VYIFVEEEMSVPENLRPTPNEKTLHAMKAKGMKAFDCTEANPGKRLNVSVPKLNKNEVLVPGTLVLRFDIDFSGGHTNNFLVQNVTRALVYKLFVKFGGTILQETVDYEIYKTFEDLFLLGEKRDNMVPEGIQSEDLCKIHSNSGDKKTSGIAAENKLNKVYRTKYCIRLDHDILTDHGVFYPQALCNDLVFEFSLVPASRVVKGSDPTNTNTARIRSDPKQDTRR